MPLIVFHVFVTKHAHKKNGEDILKFEFQVNGPKKSCT